MPPAEKDLPRATVKQGDNVEVKAAIANSGAAGEQQPLQKMQSGDV